MTIITPATPADISGISTITKLAFAMYRDELHSSTPVKALTETESDILDDINNNYVFVARKEDSEILGCIRIKKISDTLAYIYRFSVHPEDHNSGIGGALIDMAIDKCRQLNVSAITLHTNSKYFKLARYYYGKQFYIESTATDRGYIRALFVKNLDESQPDLSPAKQL